MSQDSATLSTHDYDNESCTFTINLEEVTDLNITALTTAVNALRIAANNIMTQGIEQTFIKDYGWDTPVVATNPFAQREIKWVIIVKDTNGETYRGNEIPCADLSLLENNSKYIVKGGNIVVSDTNSYVADFITAYEAIAKSNTGLALTVWDMYQVGRNT